MTGIKLKTMRPWRSAARLTVAGVLLSGACGVVGCLDRPIAPNEPRTTSTIVERLTQSAVDKIDLLLAIDNSGSMADKQDILALAVPDLVEGLVNPNCIDPKGDQKPIRVNTPECPEGLEREFEPVVDIHIGIISSSLGGHGADTCNPNASGGNPSLDDKGRLLTRGNNVVTYKDKGFLAWDPTQKLAGEANKPDADDGEADANTDSASDLNDTALIPVLTDMVRGVGQTGCGFEAQLESIYRFLIDPTPYATISAPDGRTAVPEGTDETILTQRKDFLRPDSLLAVIVLSDENDCSIREESFYFLAAQQGNNSSFRLPRATAACAANPNDPCCTSCQFDPAPNCAADPTCKDADGNLAFLSVEEDRLNSRCANQKRRFGIDFLYPIERYTKGFSESTVADRAGNVVVNPIFSDLDTTDKNTSIRNSGLVFVAGIVGVPWQDIARQDANGVPNLLTGLDAEGNAVGGFKNSDELLLPPVAGIASTWDVILGDPATNTPPADPHMIEGVDARQGTNPITKTALAGVDAANNQDPINGHEYTVTARDDLQYACVFDLPDDSNKDCAGQQNCDCSDPNNNKPLCDVAPGGGRTLQVNAKAYPGLRELQLIRDLGNQGIVGSVCPEQIDPGKLTESNYGYRPAIGAIVDKLKTALGGQCLPRTLAPDAKGQVACLIIEARNSGGSCDCASYPSRQEVSEDHKQAKLAALADPIAVPSGWDCVCEINQLDEQSGLGACQNTVPPDPVDSSVNGWCYIDPTRSPPVGAPEIVAKCPKTEQRLIRFVNQGEGQLGSTLFITCAGE